MRPPDQAQYADGFLTANLQLAYENSDDLIIPRWGPRDNSGGAVNVWVATRSAPN
jgi:hypothetical protein